MRLNGIPIILWPSARTSRDLLSLYDRQFGSPCLLFGTTTFLPCHLYLEHFPGQIRPVPFLPLKNRNREPLDGKEEPLLAVWIPPVSICLTAKLPCGILLNFFRNFSLRTRPMCPAFTRVAFHLLRKTGTENH